MEFGPTVSNGHLNDWLRDAYAMEEQAETPPQPPIWPFLHALHRRSSVVRQAG